MNRGNSKLVSIVALWIVLAAACAVPDEREPQGRPPGDDGKADEWGESARGLVWSIDDELSMDGLPNPLTDDAIDEMCAPSRALTHTEGVLCNFYERGELGQFLGAPDRDGVPVPIAYAVFRADDERAALVVSTGRTEYGQKYAELVYDLTVVNPDLGYSIYIIDHRGQGFSGRLLGNRGDPAHEEYQRGHVDSFDDYVADFRTFVQTIVRPEEHEHLLGLAHSMGGGIMTRYLQEHGSEGAFDAVVLTSPMHGITDGFLEGVAMWYLQLRDDFGSGDEYVPFKGPWSPELDFDPYAGSSLTHSGPRAELTHYIETAVPEVRLGGPTIHWAVVADAACETMQTPEESAGVDVPILLMSAGADEVVANDSQFTVCGNLPRCALETVPLSAHEMIQEEDGIRTTYLDRIVGFYEAQISGDE